MLKRTPGKIGGGADSVPPPVRVLNNQTFNLLSICSTHLGGSKKIDFWKVQPTTSGQVDSYHKNTTYCSSIGKAPRWAPCMGGATAGDGGPVPRY